jgi:hypothetical protein
LANVARYADERRAEILIGRDDAIAAKHYRAKADALNFAVVSTPRKGK